MIITSICCIPDAETKANKASGISKNNVFGI